MTTITTIRAKAFRGEGVRTHRVTVEQDGTVRVWDDLAGHYTLCHSLSESAQRRARRLTIAGRTRVEQG